MSRARAVIGDIPGNARSNTNIYEFPLLETRTKAGAHRTWQIFVALINKDDLSLLQGDKGAKTKGQNWDIENITFLPIDSDYMDGQNDIPDGSVAIYWTEYKQKTPTRSAATAITSGKNLGKINQTNPFSQALFDANTLYNTKRKAGFRTTTEMTNMEDNPTSSSDRPYPMAVNNYKDHGHKLNFDSALGIYIQYKLDGVRAVYDPRTKKFYSRRLIDWQDLNHINLDDAVKQLPPNTLLDGEFYLHGMHLNEINGIMNRTKSSDKQRLEYHIFDIIPLEKPDMVFAKRWKLLKKINTYLPDKIYVVNTHLIKSKEDGDKWFERAISREYEGIIYRPGDSTYDISFIRESRSTRVLKRKNVMEDEYEIVNFTEGDSGKDKGAIVFILRTQDGNVFHATPNMKYADRYALYKDAKKNFNEKYKGKMATIKFDDLSPAGIPLRAKVLDKKKKDPRYVEFKTVRTDK
jgi:ATP-dependent DNA ligase